MITELVLIVSLASSTMIKGTDAQPMHEMSDEDFELFVESNADMLETVGTFVLENKHTIAAGAITGLIGRTFSGARGAAALMAAGSVAEIVRELYGKATGSSSEAKIQDLERTVESLVREVNALKSNNGGASVGDFTRGSAHESREQRESHSESLYRGRDGKTYTSGGSGPYKDGYRFHESASDRSTREFTEKVSRYDKPVRSEYVTRARD